jgi:hypothetical protein
VLSIFQLLISVADAIRVNQRNASKACAFGFKSNKKASLNINRLPLIVADTYISEIRGGRQFEFRIKYRVLAPTTGP